jgi:hypothetical protein
VTSPHSTPYERITYGPHTLGDYPIVDLGHVGYDPTASPAPGVDPPSTAPIGDLGALIGKIPRVSG